MPTTRRDFLKVSLGASSLVAFGSTVPAFLSRSLLAQTAQAPNKDTLLVLLQLTGGNDGLNTVVPFEDEHYHKSRPTLRLAANQVLKITDSLGFHPEMHTLLPLLKDGSLTIVQGVGYPNSQRDHDEAMRDWHTAQPKLSLRQTGWVGRAIDLAAHPSQGHVPGLFLGPIPRPFALQAEQAIVPALATLDPWLPTLLPMRETTESTDPGPEPTSRRTPADPPNPLLDFLRHARAEAWSARQRIQTALDTRPAAGRAAYPRCPLGQDLRAIADLIRAEVGIRIYCAELGGGGIGGFDTHAHQAANHGALLRQMAQSIAAFFEDLRRARLLERVVLMTFSEFGRTLSENGRRGTDHGAAAPVFLAGGRLKGGLVGAHPSLGDLQGDAPKFHTDFRQLYATVLDRWLGFDSAAILGARFETLDLFRG